VEYQAPDGVNAPAGPGGIVVAGDTVWFTDPFNDRIGRLDVPSGRISTIPVPTADAGPLGLTMGPDGALWFTERVADKVARMSSDGLFTEWNLTPGAFPNRIVVGPDGAIWFTELHTDLIARITVHGSLTETPIDGGPVGITVGPDGNLHVALWSSHQLGRLDLTGHLTRTWAVPGALQVAGSRGDLWLTDTYQTRSRGSTSPAMRSPARHRVPPRVHHPSAGSMTRGGRCRSGLNRAEPAAMRGHASLLATRGGANLRNSFGQFLGAALAYYSEP
jgi:streptogramin lyase